MGRLIRKTTLIGKNEIYFITNQSNQLITITPRFRITGKIPELWNPANGLIRSLPAFAQSGETTSVPLQLEAHESAFIVFRSVGKSSVTEPEANYPRPDVIAHIHQPWQVTFESGPYKRGSVHPVAFATLQDWSKNENESIKYYSGTAIYKTTFDLEKKPAGTLLLDLGQVTAMAKVKINGQYVDGVWTVDSPLQSSGLLGPVNLLSISDYAARQRISSRIHSYTNPNNRPGS